MARPRHDARAAAAGHCDLGDVHVAARIDSDAVRHVKLPRPAAWLAPRLDELALGREAMHPRVAVAVGNEEIAARSDGEIGRKVERRPGALDRAIVDAGRASV